MDYEIRRIYKAISNFGMVEGVDEIIKDMDILNDKIGEYRNLTMVNSYQAPSAIVELDRANNDISTKYSSCFKDINVPQMSGYNVNVFGYGNSYERKLEDSMSKLGRVAMKKICDHYNIACTSEDISGTNSHVIEYFNRVMDNHIDDSLSDKMSFKVSYND